MSLTITSKIETPQGEELTGLYGRVAVYNPVYGDRVEAVVQLYKDKAAFEANKASYVIEGLKTAFAISYDYATGNKDILDLAHDVLIQELAAQGVTATKDLA